MKITIAGLIHRFFVVLGLSGVVLLAGSSGCQKKEPAAAEKNTPAATAAQAAAPAPSAPATPPKEDKVVATVNGTNIMESQVQSRIDGEYKPILAKYAAQSPDLAAQQEKILRQQIVNGLVVEHLLNEEARKAGIEVTDAELTAELTKWLATMNPPRTLEQYQKIVEAQGGNFEAAKRGDMRKLLYSRLFEAKFGATIAVTEADARKYYDENLEEFQVPEKVRASHILISTKPTDPNADPNQVKAQAKKKAEELLQKVKDGGDFAALAKENSDCPSKAQGGDLGLFGRGDMVPPFEDAAFALKVGEISDLVETRFGYHIIKVTGHQDPNQIAFDQAKAGIVKELMQQKRQEAARKYVDSLRQSAKITFPSGPAAPAPKPTQPLIAASADANSRK
jgi:peptidyl-prolyl cis-trans isomerase C